MKVKDLITMLQNENPEATVITKSSNPEYHDELVEPQGVYPLNEGSTSIMQCRDMMDNQKYEKKVFHMTGGKLPLLQIGI